MCNIKQRYWTIVWLAVFSFGTVVCSTDPDDSVLTDLDGTDIVEDDAGRDVAPDTLEDTEDPLDEEVRDPDAPEWGEDIPLETADLDELDEELTPSDVICRPCVDSDECGGPGNICLTLPSQESVCGWDCSGDPTVCPDETVCALIEADDAQYQQCVPESLYCVNQCGDPPRECPDEGDLCDPLTGECHPPFGLCDPCVIHEQCGEGNYCLTFPDVDASQACGIACTATGDECPEGFFCTAINEAGTILQCVPETFTCIERCEDVDCEGDQICNPLNGECEDPLEICEPCLTNAQCGGPTDLCLTLLDGNSYCTQDCGASAGANEGICPAGYVCYPLSSSISQCVPTLLTCVDHCQEPEPVVCEDDENCDPIDGTCHSSLLEICQSPCENNYDCGGQDDYCISFSGFGDAFCGADCSGDTPCPIGYSCYPLTDNLHSQCAPTDYELLCTHCDDVECPDSEACRPIDGNCYPLPAGCSDQDQCQLDEVCDYYEERCEPIGLSCRYNEYWDCPYGTACTAASFGMWGTCLLECSTRPVGCPDAAPECLENLYRPYWDVCAERGLGGPERCGRLVGYAQQVGRPCPYSNTDDGCPSGAPICLQNVGDDIPGFCTLTCDPTSLDPCPSGSRCAFVADSDDAYCLPDECGCMALPESDVGETDVLQTALDALQLDRCAIISTWAERETAGPHVANDPYRIAWVGRARNEPLLAARAARDQIAALVDSVSLTGAIELAMTDLGESPPDGYLDFGDYTICTAIQSLFADSDETPPSCDDLAELEAALPEEMRPGIAQVIAASGWAAGQRDSVLPNDMDAGTFDELVASLHRLVLAEPTAAPDLASIRDVLLGYKYSALFEAAANLAHTIEDASLQPDRSDPTTLIDIDIEYSTPRGWIVIQGDRDHTYCSHEEDCTEITDGVTLEDSVLVFIDTGGNDTYLVPAGATVGYTQAVSVFVDLGGNDLYSYVPAEVDPYTEPLLPADLHGRAPEPYAPVSLSQVGRQGSARGGIGLLYDFGLGNDHYESLRMSQGYGLLGVGALVDDGCTPDNGEDCTDILQSEALSQGAGLFGLGIALLGQGTTDVTGYHLVQGASGPLGLGMLIDSGGDDTYLAQPGGEDDILYQPPVLSSNGNWSASQGASVGVPSEMPSEGGNLSGGVGLLVDLAGHDSYSSGVMAQGVGYWHGLGLLIDSQGDDHYSTLGYAQGAGLDFGIGILVDQAGADFFNEPDTIDRNLLGSGQNFGVGVVIEESGNDTYHAGSQSLGVGFFNGTGILIENGGNDAYTVTSAETLGKATLSILGSEPPDNPRRTARTIGLFIEAEGVDNYSGRTGESPIIGEGYIWVQRTPVPEGDPPFLEYGIGADLLGTSGVTTFD